MSPLSPRDPTHAGQSPPPSLPTSSSSTSSSPSPTLPNPGQRVVVRRRLTDPTATHLLTDVLGIVVTHDDETIVVRRTSVPGRIRGAATTGPLAEAADASEAASRLRPTVGEEVTIPLHDIVALKVVPPRPVLTRDIRAVEYATAQAFPGRVHEWVDGWLLRAGDGITERSNSAIPLLPGAEQAVPIDVIRRFYAEHGTPPLLHIPDRIARSAERFVETAAARGERWEMGPDIVVMTRPLTASDSTARSGSETSPASLAPSPGPPAPAVASAPAAAADVPPGAAFSIDDEPDDEWLALYHFRGEALPADALRLLSSTIEGRMVFGRLRVDGRTVAITRGTLTHSPDERLWLGFSAVEVAADLRRRGLGMALTREVLAWGATEGAEVAYLQAVATNTAGLNLYTALGFVEHHRHRYAREITPPAEVGEVPGALPAKAPTTPSRSAP